MTCRIAFVDLDPDNYHARTFLRLIRTELRDRDCTVAGVLALDADKARSWAQANELAYFADPADLDRHVDAYAVLAPSNPEVHLALCQQVFPFGKPVYVDKTFAPDLATARQIFALADQYGTPVQTTSALRYTAVQQYVREVGQPRHMVAWGGGQSFEEYAIHPLELVISCMGHGVTALRRRGSGDQSQLLLDFTDNRTAVVNVYAKANTPFAAAVTTADQTRIIEVESDRLFPAATAALLDFLANGQPEINRAESLMIRHILDVAAMPAALQQFVTLDSSLQA